MRPHPKPRPETLLAELWIRAYTQKDAITEEGTEPNSDDELNEYAERAQNMAQSIDPHLLTTNYGNSCTFTTTSN